jgi:hypothetical protein
LSRATQGAVAEERRICGLMLLIVAGMFPPEACGNDGSCIDLSLSKCHSV